MRIPAHARSLLEARLHAHREQRWPALNELSVRYRGEFIYLTTTSIMIGKAMPLGRLTYRGHIDSLGFAMHLASSDSYENSIIMPIGKRTGTPEEVLDCVCGLYLDDPAAST